MDTVALPGTDLTPTRLAFGSANLMARLGRKDSLRLLEVAYENGITHFDTAPSYGYGECETLVGNFLQRRREQVIVTTKLGIAGPRSSRAIGAAKAVGRFAARITPMVRPLLRRAGHTLVQEGRFNPADARVSLESSLRKLRVEAVDILLLHECRPSDLDTDGLLDFLQQAVADGKVRYFGTGTDPESTSYALANRPEFTRIVQLPHSIVSPAPTFTTATITHSTVRMGLPPLVEFLKQDSHTSHWSATLSLDCSDARTLGQLLLADALRHNSSGVVLFASTNEATIRANAELVSGAHFSPEQLEAFARLSREAAAAAAQAPGR